MGTIPDSFGNCKRLEALDLSFNNLIDMISEKIFGLSSLSIGLSLHNFLIGPIPRPIGNLRNLEELDLSVNKLSGEIQVTLSSLQVLEFLNLEGNLLVFPLPSIN